MSNYLGLTGLSTVTIQGINTTGKSLANTFDPSNLRKMAAGLGIMSPQTPAANPPAKWVDTGVSGSSASNTDWRLKVSLAKSSDILYLSSTNSDDPGILGPLINTGGVIFPITPTLQITNTARYSQGQLTHSNYAMQFYEGSEAGSIMLNGEFPIQTIAEGQYLLAAIYFFRATTKMFWGADSLAGTPPPMVFLTGYGDFYFPNVPCVVTSFMHTMPDNVDYIDIPVKSNHNTKIAGSTRLPLQSTLQVTLQPIYSRESLTKFKLTDFAAGKMLKGGFI